MKKSNKEILDFFGLKVGDKVIVEGYNKPFVILEESGIQYAEEIREDCPFGSTWDIIYFICTLLGNNYEIIKPKKKIGDMKCEDFVRCKRCPFTLDNPAPNVCITSRTGKGNKTFMEIVESTQKELDDIKLRLDEEVEECEK